MLLHRNPKPKFNFENKNQRYKKEGPYPNKGSNQL